MACLGKLIVEPTRISPVNNKSVDKIFVTFVTNMWQQGITSTTLSDNHLMHYQRKTCKVK